MADVRRTPAEVVRDGAARGRAVRDGLAAEAERLRVEREDKFGTSEATETTPGTTPGQ